MKFLNSISNFKLRELFGNRRFSVPFSIICAFIIWLTVTINQKPNIERTITDITVNINLENTYASENNMSIIGDISQQKFTVIVRGPSYQVSSLSNSDITLYASAAAVNAPGEYSLEVAATALSAGNECEILSISPSTITVNFDYIETKEFSISTLAVGAVAEEGLIAENGVVSGTESDTVTIKGPRAVVNKIEKVVAIAQVNKTLKASETFDASIVLYDDNGGEISQENLTLSSNKVKVTVPISKKKTVPVVADFSNLPSGFDKSSIKWSVNHETVTIIGTPETIDKTTQVTLSPIDITTVSSSSYSFDVSAKLTEGIRLLDSIDFFTVTIDVSGYTEKTVTVTKAKYTGLSSGNSVSNKSVNIKNVKIFGPKSAIRNIQETDITAVIDLSDKKAGEHTVNASFAFGNNMIWQIGNYTTSVVIK